MRLPFNAETCRVNVENAMDVWVAANCTRQEELLKCSWTLLKDRFEVIYQDQRFIRNTDLQGVLMIVGEDELEQEQQRDEVEEEEEENRKSQFLSAWAESRRAEGDQVCKEVGEQLERFVGDAESIKTFSFEGLMSLHTLAFELGVSRACKSVSKINPLKITRLIFTCIFPFIRNRLTMLLKAARSRPIATIYRYLFRCGFEHV